MTNVPPPDQLLDVSGNLTLVTGARTGLGAGIAKRFAQAGSDVVVCDLSPADDTATEIRAMGRSCLSVVADVTDVDQVESLFERAESEIGTVDIVINNAGIYPNTGILDMSPEDWDHVMAVNLRSVFLTTKTATRRLIGEGKRGAIVNVGSIEATIPAHGHAHYAASKAGVVMFTRSAALELAQHKIRVNSVSPALFDSPVLAQRWPTGLARFLDRVPLKRVGQVEDIADTCLFLTSRASRWITGTDIAVDGGVLIAPAY